ncbi:MAG TPA: TRAM domain-containing protein [Ilumatobacteraceae bacterium]|jgi:23S rRNA (uracil1939-C5)-methyltransferase
MSSIEVRVEKMAAGGDAIARMADGRVAFVRGALPGEQVAIRVVQSKKDFVRAEVVDVLDPAPYRVVPPCPKHHAGCGGCTWQHVDADAQLQLKTSVVTEALRRTGKIVDPVVEIGASVSPWAYRTTLRLATGVDRLGLRSRHSHDVVELDLCLVSHPLLEDLLARVHVRGDGEVSLRVSAATGERSAFVVEGDVELIDIPSDVAVGATAQIREAVSGTTFQISAASFFQSGPQAAELLVAAVRDATGELVGAPTTVDAYGGVGLFAATVGGPTVTVVEASASACTDAVVNLADRKAHILCTQVEHWKPRRADLVIADPSRSGLGKHAAAVLTATEAPRIVLVSCDPVSLARDAGLLRELGYDHIRSTVLDLFPQTHHVEVVTRFDRRST